MQKKEVPASYKAYTQLDDEVELLRPQVREITGPSWKGQKVITALSLVITGCLLVTLMACLVTLHVFRISQDTTPPPLSSKIVAGREVALETPCGKLVGLEEEEAFAYKGIPYAVPPIGELRWRKPVKIWSNDSNWCHPNQRISGLQFGQACFQINPYTKQYEGSENCLFLNVWTPSIDPTDSLDVMVWIHGGFLQFGSGHVPGLSPTARISKQLNTVFVSFNYRLHVPGFLSLDLLVDNNATDSLGNFGLWDQLIALRWVQDNIHLFGGNPKKVTLFGPDAGGASIMSMISNSEANQLFRSAWLLGPAVVFNRSYADAAKHNRAFFQARTGCKNPECLRKLAPKELISAYLGKDDPSFRIRDQNDLPIQGIFPEQLIVIDGNFVTGSPASAITQDSSIDFPLLLGSSSNAVDIWPGPDDVKLWSWLQYRKYVTTSLDSFEQSISQMAMELYDEKDGVNAEFMYTSMVSDVRQTCPLHEMARELAKTFQSPIYRYVVTSSPSSPVRLFGYESRYSFHLWDAIAFFDSFHLFLDNVTVEDKSFGEMMRQIVSDFVRSGGTETGHIQWERYPHVIALLSSRNVSVVENFHEKECRFWLSHGFSDYAWVS